MFFCTRPNRCANGNLPSFDVLSTTESARTTTVPTAHVDANEFCFGSLNRLSCCWAGPTSVSSQLSSRVTSPKQDEQDASLCSSSTHSSASSSVCQPGALVAIEGFNQISSGVYDASTKVYDLRQRKSIILRYIWIHYIKVYKTRMSPQSYRWTPCVRHKGHPF